MLVAVAVAIRVPVPVFAAVLVSLMVAWVAVAQFREPADAEV